MKAVHGFFEREKIKSKTVINAISMSFFKIELMPNVLENLEIMIHLKEFFFPSRVFKKFLSGVGELLSQSTSRFFGWGGHVFILYEESKLMMFLLR